MPLIQRLRLQAARGDDSVKPAGGSGWFEPPDDTTVSKDTPDWFKVEGVETQTVVLKKGLVNAALTQADVPRRKPVYQSEQHVHFGGRPQGVKLAAKAERWAHDRHGSEDPVDTPTRYTSFNKMPGTAGIGEPWMRAPGAMDARGFRENDGPLIGKGGFVSLAAERATQERESAAKRLESWGGTAQPSRELASLMKKKPKPAVPMEDLCEIQSTTRGRTRVVKSFDRFCVQEEWRAIPKAERQRAPPETWAQGAASLGGPPQPRK